MTGLTFVSTVLVGLQEDTVARLMALRCAPSEPLADVVAKLLETQSQETNRDDPEVRAQNIAPTGKAKYRLEILGETREVNTLADALVAALTCLADLDCCVLERLANMGGRRRRHVARERDAIHPGRNDLNNQFTIEFRPSWWMGTNYSRKDTCRILKDLCKAAGLQYGRDLSLTDA